MSDTQNLIYRSKILNALSELSITDTTYKKTTWTDGSEPPLDAEHLQNIEDALALIFLDSTSEKSIIGKLVTAINSIINACKTHEDSNTTDFSNLLAQLENAKNELDDSKLSISKDHKDITDVKELLDEVVKQIQAYIKNHNKSTDTDVHSDIRDKIETLESTMLDKYIKTEDDLILYCGDSIKNTFTKA